MRCGACEPLSCSATRARDRAVDWPRSQHTEFAAPNRQNASDGGVSLLPPLSHEETQSEVLQPEVSERSATWLRDAVWWRRSRSSLRVGRSFLSYTRRRQSPAEFCVSAAAYCATCIEKYGTTLLALQPLETWWCFGCENRCECHSNKCVQCESLLHCSASAVIELPASLQVCARSVVVMVAPRRRRFLRSRTPAWLSSFMRRLPPQLQAAAPLPAHRFPA